MADFPALSRTLAPLEKGYSERYQDTGDLSSPAEAGYKITRRQFTRRPKVYTMNYAPLTDTDKNTMESFIHEQGFSGAFNWIQPKTGDTKVVRFIKLPSFEMIGASLWMMSGIEIEEV